MVVVISVSPALPGPELVPVLEGACTEGVRPRRCEVHTDGAPPDIAVDWSAPLTVHVETRGAVTQQSQSLDFRQEDPEPEKWRAVGLVAAALLNRAARETPPPPPLPVPPPPRGLPTLWMEGGGTLGSGLDGGPVSFGGVLRGDYRFRGLPFYVGAGASYAAAGPGPRGLDASWTTFSLNGGVTFAVSEVAVRARVDLLLARLVAKRSDAPPAETSGSRQLAGSGVGVELAWPAKARVAGVLGAEGAFLSSGTSIRVGEARASAFPALGYRFFLGIQVAVLP